MTRPSTWRDEADDFRDILGRLRRLELAQAGSHEVSNNAAFPLAPLNGRDFYYQLPGGGVWHFKFNRSTGLWDFVGGPPTSSIPSVGVWSGRSMSTYQALTAESGVAEPSITVPFAGTYLVSFSGGGYSDVNGTNCYLGLSVNSATPSADADAAVTVAAANQVVGFHRNVPATTFAKGDVLTLRGKGSGSGWGYFNRLSLVLTPVSATP